MATLITLDLLARSKVRLNCHLFLLCVPIASWPPMAIVTHVPPETCAGFHCISCVLATDDFLPVSMARGKFNLWKWIFPKKRQFYPPNSVSSPHPVSNLRLIRPTIPPDETKSEREYRLKWMALQKWNQCYWQDHNKSFFSQRDLFVKSKGSGQPSYDELANFYKKFLEENHKKHLAYSL